MAISKCAFLALFSLLFVAVLSAKPTSRGFTLDFIRRDSPNSPLHNPKQSRYAQIHTAISRSIARAKHLSVRLGLESESNDATSEIIPNSGEYLMNFTIGTPSFPILAIADTGSDLTWTQCEPCDSCYEQKAPIFDPKKSSTYKQVSCSATQCTSEVSSGFEPSCDDSKHCQYSVSYGDQSSSNGAVATETFTLGSESFTETLFGCGFENQGTFSSAGSGIIGLGNGPSSLIGQLDKSISGKFSYCLVPLSSKATSKIKFGEDAVVSGDDAVSTPIVDKDPATYYWLTLEAFTVGKERIPYSGSDSIKAADTGNIIIDSGTTLLILPQDFFDSVTAGIQKQVAAKPVDDPSGQLQLCYNANEFKAPEIVANFDGADLKLNDFNAWLATSDNVVCFAAAAASNLGIYGNLAQMNFLVGYDKLAKKVSFQPADCTKRN